MTLILRKNLSPKPERDLVTEKNFPALRRMCPSDTKFPLIHPKVVGVVRHPPLHLQVDHQTRIPLPAQVLQDMCPRVVEMTAEVQVAAEIRAEAKVAVLAEEGLTPGEEVVIVIIEAETTGDMDHRTIDRLVEVTTQLLNLGKDLTLDHDLIHVTAASREDHLHITKTLGVTE